MKEELTRLLELQNEKLKDLILLLENQYKSIMKKEVFELEFTVEALQNKSKEIAQIEIERRSLLGNLDIKEFINTSNDKKLQGIYSLIQQTLNRVIEQKDTNDVMLKQQLLFTNKMLAVLNPDRQIKTYNSYGNLKK